MLEFPFNVEGDHPRTAGALSLHHVVLRVGGQAYDEEKHESLNPSNLCTRLPQTSHTLFIPTTFKKASIFDLQFSIKLTQNMDRFYTSWRKRLKKKKKPKDGHFKRLGV